MDRQEQLQRLKGKITDDIDKIGGIEKFNKCNYAHEIISIWIGRILDIL